MKSNAVKLPLTRDQIKALWSIRDGAPAFPDGKAGAIASRRKMLERLVTMGMLTSEPYKVTRVGHKVLETLNL